MRRKFLGLGVLAGLLCMPLVAKAEPAYALVDGGANQQILTFDTAAPGTITRTQNVTGLGQGEKLVAIDVRPSTGFVHVLSADRKLYAVNAAGTATLLITIPDSGPASLGAGDKFDMDFNPSGEAVRIINTATRENIRVVLAPAVAIGNGGMNDQPLSYATAVDNGDGPNVVGIGYANNFAQTTATRLFGINIDLKGAGELLQPANRFQFVELTNATAANFDRVVPIKDLGFNVTSANGAFGGYDVSPNTGNHYFALVPDSDQTKSHIYRVSAPDASATFTDLGAIGGTSIVRDIAIPHNITAVDGVVVTKDSTGHRMSTFNSALPGTLSGTKSITGLNANEDILAIDRRPKNNMIYVITSASRLLTLDRTTAALTPVGAPFAITFADPTLAGMDFNPVGDAIRVVSGTQNFFVSPETGVATDATALTYTAGDPHAADVPNVSAAAYTRNVNDGGPTRLYVYSNKTVASQGFALDGGTTGGFNGGQLTTLADLGVSGTNTTDHSFDIVNDDTAFLSLTTANGRRLYQLDLATGALRYGVFFGQAFEATERIVGVTFDGAAVIPNPDGGPTPRPDSGPGPVPTTTPTTPPPPGANGGANANGAAEGGGCDCSTVPGGPVGGATLIFGIGAVAAVLRRRRASNGSKQA